MRVRNSGNNKNQSNIIIGIGSPVPQVGTRVFKLFISLFFNGQSIS